MIGRSRFACARRLTAVLMTALLLGGCSTWRMQGQAPATAVSARPSPPHVRITRQDGTRLEVYQAVVQGDSLVGVGPAASPRDTIMYGRFVAASVTRPRIAVALSDICALEIRSVRGWLVLLGAGIIVVGFVVWAGLSMGELNSGGR